MASLDRALHALGDTLAGRAEVKRFRTAKQQVARDPDASKALSAFLTEAYSRARVAGGPSRDLEARLSAQRQAVCRHPAVKAYLDAQDEVQKLLLGIQQHVQQAVLGRS